MITDKNMSSAMKNRDNPFGWTTTVIICKRWFKNQVKHYLYLLLCAKRLVVRLRNDVAFRTVIQPHYTQRFSYADVVRHEQCSIGVVVLSTLTNKI